MIIIFAVATPNESRTEGRTEIRTVRRTVLPCEQGINSRRLCQWPIRLSCVARNVQEMSELLL
jgi:hypothetical protein